MKRISILLFCVIFIVTVCNGFMVWAASDVTASAEVDGRRVTITGNVANAGAERIVTLLVGDVEQILYIDEKHCDTSGGFQFSFLLPEGLPVGEYEYRIGGSHQTAPFAGTFTYTGISSDMPVIQATATVDGRYVTVIGEVTKTTEERTIDLVVNNGKNVICRKSEKTDATGKFSLVFDLPATLAAGDYLYRITGGNGVAPFDGVITFDGNIQTRAFVETDLDIALSAYVPTVSGTIQCIAGKEVQLNIVNVTDNIVIKSVNIRATDGIYNLSCTLPSLLYSKTCRISVNCMDDKRTLASIDAEISSATYKVSASGTAMAANGISLDVGVKSTNTDLIDKRATISGTHTQALTFPNLIPTAAFELGITGYEEYSAGVATQTYSVTGVAGQTVNVIAKGNGISSFENRNFELEYNPSELKASDFFGVSIDASLSVGEKGNIEIVSYRPGKIVFRMKNITVPEGKVWSGVLNLFKFKFADDYNGTSYLYLK